MLRQSVRNFFKQYLPTFNQLVTITTFTYRPSLVKINARNFELSW